MFLILPHNAEGLKFVFSYKEDSDEATDSDDLIEASTPAPETEETENRETIEKIIKHRMGKKGATGSKTINYNVQENGDPNTSGSSLKVNNDDDSEEDMNSDKEDKKPHELEKQYLIKWRGWAHIHNTWETLASVQDQKVNGIKKLENYIKKEEEIAEWRLTASPEDFEYYICQKEMMNDLYKSHQNVERIIGK